MLKSNFSLLMESEELKEYLGEQSSEMDLSDVISNIFLVRDSQDLAGLLQEDESQVHVEISIEN